MIRRGDDHGIEVLVFQELPEVTGDQFRHLRKVLGDPCLSLRRLVVVDVAEPNDLRAESERIPKIVLPDATAADQSNPNPSIGSVDSILRSSRRREVRRESGGGGPGHRMAEKRAARLLFHRGSMLRSTPAAGGGVRRPTCVPCIAFGARSQTSLGTPKARRASRVPSGDLITALIRVAIPRGARPSGPRLRAGDRRPPQPRNSRPPACIEESKAAPFNRSVESR